MTITYPKNEVEERIAYLERKQNEETANEIFEQWAETLATPTISNTPTGNKRGRKTKNTSCEKLEELCSVQFSQKLFQDIDDLAYSYKRPVLELLTYIVTEFVDKHSKRLALFRKMQEED